MAKAAPATAATPDSGEMIARARALAPKLAEFSAESDALRSLHPTAMGMMQEAGLFHIPQPRRIGGYEQSMSTLYAVSRALSEECPASGWVYMVLAAHSWIMGMFPEPVQDEIHASDPHTIISGTLAPQGNAELVEGGLRVSGRWQFCSGVDHAKWSLVSALLPTSTEDRRDPVHFMMPAADYTVDDTWHVLGLRGTGSKDLVLENMFVPDSRVMSTKILFRGDSEHARRHPGYLFQMPVMPGLANFIATVVLGISRSALTLFVERTRSRPHIYGGGQKINSVGIQLRIAEAEAELTAAELLWENTCALFDGLDAERAQADIPLRSRIKLQAAYTQRLCVNAIDRIFQSAGAHAIFDGSPLQHKYRDLLVASHHAATDFDDNAEIFGRIALGLKPNSPLL